MYFFETVCWLYGGTGSSAKMLKPWIIFLEDVKIVVSFQCFMHLAIAGLN